MTHDASAAPDGSFGAVVSPARRIFGVSLLVATLFLIYAGAEVKSREAGLSVPDWPKSYGMWMPPMVGNVFYEHGHRMVAAAVGLLTLILAIWTARAERRQWVRRLAWVALAAVVVQGLLGGITVRYLLPTPVSMAHGALAQTFLCVVGWLAYATGREWNARHRPAQGTVRPLAPTVLATAAVFIQLMLGAWMRHTEAGLAVPFFPVSETGAWLPEYVDFPVVVHMLHRGFAVVVAVLVLRAAWMTTRRLPVLRPHAVLLALLVLCQILLGASVIWYEKAPVLTSVHVLTGAGLLLAVWLLALRSGRLEPAASVASAGAGQGGAASRSIDVAGA